MGAKAITALLAIGINLALVLTMLRLIEPSAHPQLDTRVTTEVQLVPLTAFQESEPPPERIEEPVSHTPEPPTPAPPMTLDSPPAPVELSDLKIEALPVAPMPLERPALELSPTQAPAVNSESLTLKAAALGQLAPAQKMPPIYPAKALSQGIEGYVIVEFSLALDGSVKDARVVDAKPRRYFKRAALRAIKQWKYPANSEEARQKVRLKTQINFKLET